jgi:hypothetical protein
MPLQPPPGVPVPPGGYAVPGPYGAPPPGYGPPPGPVIYDPHGVGVAASRLSGSARRNGKVALAVLASVLDEGEVVTMVVQGRVRGEPGVVALVGSKVVLVNERQWKPDVVVIDLDSKLRLHGWQDERSATVTFVVDDRPEVVERIGDRVLAIELAQRVRHLTAGPNGADAPAAAPPPAPAPQPPPPPPPPPPPSP